MKKYNILLILIICCLHSVWTKNSFAQTGGVPPPEITNPTIREIIQSRAPRVKLLDKYKASGCLGENNKALIEVRSLDELSIRERSVVQKLVKAENYDREQMFEEIAEATGTDLSQLPNIRSNYANTLRKNARLGEWIQLPDGKWLKN